MIGRGGGDHAANQHSRWMYLMEWGAVPPLADDKDRST